MIIWDPWPTFRCGDCGTEFKLSERATRERMTGRTTASPRCELCRNIARLPEPTDEDREWWEEPARPGQLEVLLAHVSLLRP